MTHRIVLDVDGSKLFDMLRVTNGDLSEVAGRLSMPLLAGEMPSLADVLGLALYGIFVVEVGQREEGGRRDV